MAFDVEGARAAGYSDAEIADHMAQSRGFDLAGARAAGYSDPEAVAHMAGIGPTNGNAPPAPTATQPAAQVVPATTPETSPAPVLSPDQIADLPPEARAFYSPGPSQEWAAKNLKPTDVIPVSTLAQVQLDYAQSPEMKIAIASSDTGIPRGNLTVAKDGSVYTQGGTKVGGLGGNTFAGSASNLAKSVIGGIASSPASLIGNGVAALGAPELIASPPFQGGLSAADEVIRRGVGKYILPSQYGLPHGTVGLPDAEAVGLNGAAGAAGTFAMNHLPGVLNWGLSKLGLTNSAIPALAALSPEAADTAASAMKQSPIPLTVGQATNDPRILNTEARLRMMPGGLPIARDQANSQIAASRSAVDAYASALSSTPTADRGVLGQNFVDGVKNAATNQAEFRSAEGGPAFDQAFADWRVNHQSPLDSASIVRGIDATIADQNTPSGAVEALQRARRSFFSPDGTIKTDPQAIHNAKRDLQDIVSSLSRSGDNTAASYVKNVQGKTIQFLQDNVPGYADATGNWAAMSRPIDDTQESVLNNIAQTPWDKAHTAPGKIFNPVGNAPNPPSIMNAYRNAIQSDYPGAWNDGMAARIREASDTIPNSANDVPINYMGNIQKELGGTRAAQQMWGASMTPQEYANFESLLGHLQAASRGSRGQSWTFSGQGDMDAIRKETSGPIQSAISSIAALLPGNMMETYNDYLLRRNSPALARALFTPAEGWQNRIPFNPKTLSYQVPSQLFQHILSQGVNSNSSPSQ